MWGGVAGVLVMMRVVAEDERFALTVVPGLGWGVYVPDEGHWVVGSEGNRRRQLPKMDVDGRQRHPGRLEKAEVKESLGWVA